MFRCIKLSLIICLFSLLILLEGCSNPLDYSKDKRDWGDVNKSAVKLEKQTKDTFQALETLEKKSSVPTL